MERFSTEKADFKYFFHLFHVLITAVQVPLLFNSCTSPADSSTSKAQIQAKYYEKIRNLSLLIGYLIIPFLSFRKEVREFFPQKSPEVHSKSVSLLNEVTKRV